MDSEDEDAQMRQMMGFASFGNKKRKPNHGQKDVTNTSATSSNSTPLGKRSITTKDPLSLVPASLPPRPSPPPGTKQAGDSNSGWIASELENASPTRQDQTDSANQSSQQTSVNLITSLKKTSLLNSDNPSAQTSSFDLQAPSFEPTQQETPSDPITVFSKNDVRSDPNYWTSQNHGQTQDNVIGYTSPWTGMEMTIKDLREYAVGKQELQPNGDIGLTYFKTSFVAEGIWDRWEKRKEGR